MGNICVIEVSREILEMFLKGSDAAFETNAPADIKIIDIVDRKNIYRPLSFIFLAESSSFSENAEGAEYPVFEVIVTRLTQGR